MSSPARTSSAGRRLKLASILAVLVLSALTFLAWSQSWGTLLIDGGTTTEAVLDVPGSVAAPALSALGLAGIALAGALAIAGPFIRVILGALEVLLGVSVLLSGIGALSDPVAAGASIVTTTTGVAGTDSIRDLASVGAESAWPAVTVALGALMVVAGLVIIVTVKRWPASGRKYQAVTFEASDGRQSADPADFFDETEGDETEGTAASDGPGAFATDTDTDDAEGTDEVDDADTEAGGDAGPDAAARARDAAVDNWDSLTRGTDPTAR